MSDFVKAIKRMRDDEAVIQITDTNHKKTSVDTILIASFDDGTKGIYSLSLTHGVRVWVVWKGVGKDEKEG